MTNDLLLVLIGLGVIVIIAAIFVIYTVKKSGDKKEANKFLEGLTDELKEMILKLIRNFDPSIIKDITEADIIKIEEIIIKNIYDVTWEYVQKVVEEKSKEDSDFFTKAILALLENKEFVEEFIRDLLEKGSTMSIIHSRAQYLQLSIAENRIEECETKEQELQEEFSDQEKYFENANEDDIPVGEYIDEPTEEELSKLNPQRDEDEEELDLDNDISVEVLEDDIYYDKSGRARSKKTGKWTKDPNK